MIIVRRATRPGVIEENSAEGEGEGPERGNRQVPRSRGWSRKAERMRQEVKKTCVFLIIEMLEGAGDWKKVIPSAQPLPQITRWAQLLWEKKRIARFETCGRKTLRTLKKGNRKRTSYSVLEVAPLVKQASWKTPEKKIIEAHR